MAVLFELENVFEITGRGYFITAKLIGEGKDFWLPKYSKLGNIEITTFLNKPRVKNREGKIREDLWAFQLRNKEDMDKLRPNEVVELFPGDKIKFLYPWMKIESLGNFETELKKEISKSHCLFGKRTKAIGKREESNHVLFEIEETEYAVVQLTWSEKKESSDKCPKTQIFKHWTEVYERVIVEDNLKSKK